MSNSFIQNPETKHVQNSLIFVLKLKTISKQLRKKIPERKKKKHQVHQHN